MRPPDEVLAAFGVVGEPVPVDGGQGTTWRAGDVILKPLDMPPDAIRWLDEVVRDRIGHDGQRGALRLSLPLASASRGLVVDGWTAFPVLAGRHQPARWLEIAEVGRAFAESFAGVSRPAFLDLREDAWSCADRFAWEELDLPGAVEARHVAELQAVRRPIDEPSGIIHGDLTGNVLFDASEPPAVIDLTPYWRPIRYSVAIVAVDAVCFEGAPLTLWEAIDADAGFTQHLLRALLFRIVTDWLHGAPPSQFEAYSAAVSHVMEVSS